MPDAWTMTRGLLLAWRTASTTARPAFTRLSRISCLRSGVHRLGKKAFAGDIGAGQVHDGIGPVCQMGPAASCASIPALGTNPVRQPLRLLWGPAQKNDIVAFRAEVRCQSPSDQPCPARYDYPHSSISFPLDMPSPESEGWSSFASQSKIGWPRSSKFILAES